MPIYEFEGKRPKIHAEAWVAETASIIGDVEIGPGVHVGPGASIRADFGKIIAVGEASIEDCCVIHARPEQVVRIGKYVTVGHGSVLHGCTIDDYATISMAATVCDFAHVGEWAVVAEGAVVKNHFEVPPKKLAAGVPAKIIGDVSEKFLGLWKDFKKFYPELARKRYPEGLKKIEL
jgi:carbonic anhydrase/acetyltransferase-like protein (isoleucine patch superfamily)